MSRGDLQEMEVKTQQSKTAVNANAGTADPMPKLLVAHLLVMRIWVDLHQKITKSMMIQQS
jgi:hypothetical protein